MKLKIYLVLVMLIFVVSTVEARSSSWSITERYSVTDFDKEGNNIYLGEDGHFYVDKINLLNKELIIERFDGRKKLIDVIKTGMIYERTKKNQFLFRNSQIALFFKQQYLYIFYPGNDYDDRKSYYELWRVDLNTKEKKRTVKLKGIKSGSVFSQTTNWGLYDDHIWSKGTSSYQMKLISRKNKILLDGYLSSDNPEGGSFVHDYYIFSIDGTLLEWAYEDQYLPDKYPITIKENGEIVKGILAEDEMEKLANDLGYTIKEGWTVYRGFENTDLYVIEDREAWLSKDLLKSGATKRSDLNYVSSIYGLVQENGKWKVKEFVNPTNFPELKYNVFIDRILKAEGNKLWLWVRIGYNITESYEERHFDREIWVIEKQ